MARYFRYATHAQVLSEHPRFAWEAVVDPSEEALAAAGEHYRVPLLARSLEELTASLEPQVAVIATPPGHRSGILDRLPGLAGILVEKPLGLTLHESRAFLQECERRRIMVQVNLWRRADAFFRELAAGGLGQEIGRPLAVFGLYGNGIRNNGTHMVDFVRMLLGEIDGAQALDRGRAFMEGPLEGDPNFGFVLTLPDGLNAVFQSLPFRAYREIGLDIWGESGRLNILQEGLGIFVFPRARNRALQDAWEIASDRPRALSPTCGEALYRMYDNLADALEHGIELWSPGESALRAEQVVEELVVSFEAGRQTAP
jgi:predicted dehydrogenase